MTSQGLLNSAVLTADPSIPDSGASAGQRLRILRISVLASHRCGARELGSGSTPPRKRTPTKAKIVSAGALPEKREQHSSDKQSDGSNLQANLDKPTQLELLSLHLVLCCVCVSWGYSFCLVDALLGTTFSRLLLRGWSPCWGSCCGLAPGVLGKC